VIPSVVLFALGVAPARAAALEFRVVSLVEARAAGWPAIPEDAGGDPDRLSFRRRACLAPTAAIPVRDPAVRAALTLALAPLDRPDRRRTARVLDAIGEWTAGAIAESAETGNPAAWRTAAATIRDGTGQAWERLRVLVALARAAGIPARPSFNGVPVALVWITASPAAGRTSPKPGAASAGFWTVWDPLHPSGSFRALPVLWQPFGSEEVPPLAVAPPGTACRPLLEGRRYARRADAAQAFEAVRATGRFSDPVPAPLVAGSTAWWEVWSIGAVFDPAPPGSCTATVPLPFVKEMSYGARERGVWISDPARLRSVSAPLARTDQELGGLKISIAVRLKPAPVTATMSGA